MRCATGYFFSALLTYGRQFGGADISSGFIPA